MKYKIEYRSFIATVFTLLMSGAVCSENSDILQQIPDYSDTPKIYTTDEKNALLDKAVAINATKYGHIYLHSKFWHFSYAPEDFRTRDMRDPNSITRKSLLENIFNGQFADQSTRLQAGKYFILLVDAYSRNCRYVLGPNAATVSFTTEKTTTNSYGSYTQKIGGYTAYMIPRYVKTYRKSSSLGGSGLYGLKDEIKHIKHLLKTQGCNSEINAQLIENLHRFFNGMPSLQNDPTTNVKSESKNSDNGGSSRAASFLYYNYHDTSPGKIEYVFANPSSDFSPPSPRHLLDLTFKNFGKENVNKKFRRSFSWKPTLTIKNSSVGQLERMTVGYMMGSGSYTLPNFKRMAMGLNGWDSALDNNKALSDKVYSHFAKLLGEQKHRVVECVYEGGGYLVYWLDTRPEGSEPEALRKIYKYHPLLVVQAKRDSCPVTLYKGDLGRDYIFNTVTVNTEKPSVPLPPLINYIRKYKHLAPDTYGCNKTIVRDGVAPLVKESRLKLVDYIARFITGFEIKMQDKNTMVHKNFSQASADGAEILKCEYKKPKIELTFLFLASEIDLDEEANEFLYYRKIRTAQKKCPASSSCASIISNDFDSPISDRIAKRRDEERKKLRESRSKQEPIQTRRNPYARRGAVHPSRQTSGKPQRTTTPTPAAEPTTVSPNTGLITESPASQSSSEPQIIAPKYQVVDRDFSKLKRSYTPFLRYPLRALELEETDAKVRVSVTFNEDGIVQSVIVGTESLKWFDRAANDQAMGMRFEPETDDSKPVWIRTEFDIVFDLAIKNKYLNTAELKKEKLSRIAPIKRKLRKMAKLNNEINFKLFKSIKKQNDSIISCTYSIKNKKIGERIYWYKKIPVEPKIIDQLPDDPYFDGLREKPVEHCPKKWLETI